MRVKIYDMEGKMSEVEQVDARECVDMGYYTIEPPESKPDTLEDKKPSYTVALLKEKLTEKGIEFDDSMKKTDLMLLLEAE